MTSGTDTATDAIQAARAALAQQRWAEALERFRAADQATDLDAEDLAGLGDAAWWNSEFDLAIDARERAFARYLRAGRTLEAARLALALARDYLDRMQTPIARAFKGRAERLLADLPESPVHAELAIMRSMGALERGDIDTALELADTALGIARRTASRDMEGMALLARGRALIARGDVADGLALIDEATGAALVGDLAPQTTGFVYCLTIDACAHLADFERAGDWTDVALRWCERNATSSGFPGACRIHQAQILRYQGEWPRAEASAKLAADELRQAPALVGEAWYEVGEVRLRMGDLDAAEEAFLRAHENGIEPQPGLALLRLAQGRPDSALAAIRRALSDATLTPLVRWKLLPAHVDIAVAAGDLDEARAAAGELDQIAETYRSPGTMLRAVAKVAQGKVALAVGALDEAMEALRAALRLWVGLHSPYETARTRLLLAAALERLGEPDGAVLELRTAKGAFERLGARPEKEEAAERIKALSGGDAAVERAVRTFMLTDIVDSTPLVQAIGDDAWTDLVRWHDHTLRGLFRGHDGEEIDHAGDGFLVAFPDAGAALDCGVAIQRELAAHRRAHGFAPAVRIGLHLAEALAEGGAFRGKGVHEAARIAALAGAGDVVASLATTESAARGYPLSPPREVTLKGFAEPVPVVSVDWS